MHDTFLFERISNEVNSLCEKNKMKKLTYINVSVNHDSHVNENSLFQHLKDKNNNLVGEWTKVNVQRDYPERLVAMINQIEGE